MSDKVYRGASIKPAPQAYQGTADHHNYRIICVRCGIETNGYSGGKRVTYCKDCRRWIKEPKPTEKAA